MIEKSVNADTAFYKYWTMKQALVKAKCCGITNTIRGVLSAVAMVRSIDFWYLKEIPVSDNSVSHIATKEYEVLY